MACVMDLRNLAVAEAYLQLNYGTVTDQED